MKIKSQIKTKSEAFEGCKQAYSEFLHGFHNKLESIYEAGGEKAVTRLRERNKLLPRERIEKLIDADSHFLELSILAGDSLYKDSVPAGGIVTGIAMVAGRPCMVVANDPTVKGGTYYPITVKKHLRAQEIAEKNSLPCLYLVDSGGAFLPMQDEVFPDKDDFGRIFYNQARMSAAGIAQISSVHGLCTAGGAYIPAMSDQSIIVKNQGNIFLGGPPLVKAATGEDVTADELGGSDVHTRISGVADHLAEDDTHAMQIMRQIVSRLNHRTHFNTNITAARDPAYDPNELLGVIPLDLKKAYDIREVVARIVDGSELFEFKRDYGTSLLTGFGHLGGIPVGIIGNNGVLFSESALKGTHFIELCTKESIPLLFLQNVTGFIVGKTYEHGGIAKDGAKLVHAVANANVPKITMVVGGSYGAGNYGMCGRAFDPNFMFTLPHSRISVMGGEQAANVLATVKADQARAAGKEISEAELQAIRQPILEKYALESSAFYASARLWDDGIIDPRAMRSVLTMALSSCLHYKWPKTKYGTFRM